MGSCSFAHPRDNKSPTHTHTHKHLHTPTSLYPPTPTLSMYRDWEQECIRHRVSVHKFQKHTNGGVHINQALQPCPL